MTIVVGFDDSGVSHEALRVALGLAAELSDDVVVVYGVEPPGNLGDEHDAVEAAIVELGQQAMARAREVASESGMSIEAVLIEEGSAQALVDIADQRDARMIVVGAHGPGTIRSAVLGSTTRRVLLSTLRPVLVVQAPEEF